MMESLASDIKILSDYHSPFEALYLKVRKKENRVLSDEEVVILPDTFFYNRHRAEWEMRSRSFAKILAYFNKRDTAGKVLDLGCGNGWFAAGLAKSTPHEIIGLEVNKEELEQANRVFSYPNLNFVFGDFFKDIFPEGQLDYIIINGVIQYFPDLPALLNRCRYYLRPGGELHILDSPLYKVKDLDGARQRSKDYYRKMGVPEMVDHYFHHRKDEIELFNSRYLYKPPAGIMRLFRKSDNPFPWVRIIN